MQVNATHYRNEDTRRRVELRTDGQWWGQHLNADGSDRTDVPAIRLGFHFNAFQWVDDSADL